MVETVVTRPQCPNAPGPISAVLVLAALVAGAGCSEATRQEAKGKRQVSNVASGASPDGKAKRQRGNKATRQQGKRDTGHGTRDSERRIDNATLESALEQARARLTRFVPTPDLIDSLYFGWFERPYRRATIALALKTVMLLERELRLRQSGNGVIRDRRLAAVLDWLDSALERATHEAYRAGFRPDRTRFDPTAILTAPRSVDAGASPPRFAFMDRSSATRYDRTFGDFDLLACTGMGAYGLGPRIAVFADRDDGLGGRSQALGIGVVVQTTGTESPSASWFAIQPLTLAALLATPDRAPGSSPVLAASDPPGGESWGASLARRSLLRVVTPGQSVVVTGWAPPRRTAGTAVPRVARASCPCSSGAPAPSATRLAMWVHALAGQQLGVIEGWRDLRDGSRLAYASLATHPDQVETMAHTALDLLYYAGQLGAFRTQAPVAVVIDASAVRRQDPNRWSPEAADLFDTLLNRQLLFDVMPDSRAVRAGFLKEYRVVLVAVDGTGGWPIASAVGETVAHARSGSLADLRRYVESLPEPMVSRDLRAPTAFVAYDPDGRVASACLVFNGRAADGEPCFAVANLQARRRTVVIRSTSYPGNPLFRDLLTNEPVAAGRDQVQLAGHQVRLFVPLGGGRE